MDKKPIKKLTGLNREIRASYRLGLKMINTKPIIYRKNWFKYLSDQFKNPRVNELWKRREYESIEYQLRRIKNQIELYSSPSVHQIHLPSSSSTTKTTKDTDYYYYGWVAKGGKQGLGR